MLLAVDIGNSNIVMGIFKGNELAAHWRVNTDLHRTADEYALLIMDMIRSRGIGPDAISGVILSTVVPPLTPVFTEAARRHLGIDASLVDHRMKTGLKISYRNPAEVGADRIVNAAAGYHLYGGPLIIVDFGTATTFCAVSAKGVYLGGAIAPGVSISLEALYTRAAKLPKVDLVRPPSVIGKDTASSMQSGTLFGFACLVDGMIERIASEMSATPHVVATGGLATLIHPETRNIREVRPHLTLEGLRILFEKNTPKSGKRFSP